MKNTNENLKYCLIAEFISQFGAGMLLTCISWFVLDNTGKNEAVGFIFSLNIVFGIITSLFSGLIADRFCRKSIIIFTNFGRAVTILIALLLLLSFKYNIWIAILLAFSNGVGWNIYFAAYRSLLKDITTEKDRLTGNSFAEVAMQVAMFSAGAIAGFLYKISGFSSILIINALTFVIANIFVYKIKVSFQKTGDVQKSILKQYTEGIQYVKANTFLVFLGIIFFIPFIVSSAFNVALPGYVISILKADSVTFGIIDMFYGVGASISGLLIIRLAKKFKRNSLTMFMLLLGTLAGVIMFLNNNIVGACIGTVILGFSAPTVRTIIYTEIMETVSSEIMGRVLAILNLIGMFLQTIFGYYAGLIMDRYNSSYGFLLVGALLFVGFIAMMEKKYNFSVTRN